MLLLSFVLSLARPEVKPYWVGWFSAYLRQVTSQNIGKCHLFLLPEERQNVFL